MEDAGRSKAPIPVLSANTLKRGTVPVEMGGRNYGHAETYLTAYGARHDSMCWCSVLEGSRSSDGGKTPNLCMFGPIFHSPKIMIHYLEFYTIRSH
ncbi:hypothetical protein CDAR_55891 [Caerostris darwini]|uniref:Uncharacterized protein n=1 Tax=Caerostris darwini TaxID=1538125 RepID=A0AAV4PA39_9ARAC|nr:hypothetical protein CDAR_55891 [Caerostris darwini]